MARLPQSTLHIPLLLLLYFVMVLRSSPQLSPAFDEPNHVRSGMTMLTAGAFVDVEKAWWTELDPMHPPSDVLPALAARLAGASPDYREQAITSFNFVLAARWANHLLGAGILLLVYFWSSQVWGPNGALLSGLTLLANPLFLSHATIVSSDLYMCAGAMLYLYALWRFLLKGSPPLDSSFKEILKPGILLGLLLGIAIGSKLSNLSLIPFTIIAAGAVFYFRSREQRTSRWYVAFLKTLTSITIICTFGLALGALIYDLGHLGLNKTIYTSWPLPLSFGEKLASASTIASGLGYIMPKPFFNGGLQAPTFAHHVIFYLFRMPLGLLLMQLVVLLCCFFVATRKQQTTVFYLLFGVFGFFVFFATRGLYLGLRHVLLPIVLSAVLAGALLRLKRSKRNFTVIFCTALIALGTALLEMLAATPWQLSYCNFVSANTLTCQSDADWGQGLVALKKWQNSSSKGKQLSLAYFGNNRPEEFGIVYQGMPAPMTPQSQGTMKPGGSNTSDYQGYVAISANHLAGKYFPGAGKSADYYHAWLKETPVTTIGNTIRIYER